MIYLNCSYSEKDEAKAQGAQWDSGKQQWFVPRHLYKKLESFNKWSPNGRKYIECPFKDKGRAKSKGARWDGEVQKWYFLPNKGAREEDFSEWLPSTSICSPPVASSSTKTSNSSKKRKVKSEDRPAKSPKPIKASQTAKDSSKKRKVKSENRATESPELNKIPKTAKKAKKSPQNEHAYLSYLPKISSSLKVAQLSHELYHRNKSITGTSNKNKEWFLQRLGVGSVWVTSPEARGLFLESLPQITEDLKVTQLRHEVMERNPEEKGLSSKSKAWFLEHLGVGSIWTTCPSL